MHYTRRSPGRAIVLLIALLAMAQAQAMSLLVVSTADPPVGTDDCVPPDSSSVVCVSLRGAITRALSSADVASTITLAPLDGQTIVLSQFSNDLGCVTANAEICTSGSLGSEFGASAFFITNGKALTIDAANGLVHGVTIARCTDSAACYGNGPVPDFRLFDVAPGNALTLLGLTLENGSAQGGSATHGGGALGAGGAVFNQGQLVVDRCTFASNKARGGDTNAYDISTPSGATGGGGAGQPGQTYNQDGRANGGGPNGGQGALASTQGGYAGADGSFGGGGGVGAQGLATNGGPGGAGGFGGGGGPGGDGLYDGSHPVDGGNGGTGGLGGGGGGQGYPYLTDGPGAGGFGGGFGSYEGSNLSIGGSGAGMGGAIFNDAGSVTVTNSTFAGNTASGGANALASSTNSDGYGGALFNYNGNMALDFVTLSGNSATAGSGGSGGNADGGAIYCLGDSLAACSAGGNSCSSSAASLTLNNTIAANNTGANDVATNAIDGGGNTSNGGSNVITTNAGFAGTVVSTADPKLGALIPGGGLESVMIPAVGSPAIDAGSCDATTIDQRGDPRPWQQTPCDIGAVETIDVIFRNGFE